MTNKEIKKAVERIAQIKMWKKEEVELRAAIVAEFSRRGKDKINLGGPTKEDYVKFNEAKVACYLPSDFYYALKDDRKTALGILLQATKISRKGMVESMGEEWVKENMTRDCSRYQRSISYRISSDEKNMVRGIDL